MEGMDADDARMESRWRLGGILDLTEGIGLALEDVQAGEALLEELGQFFWADEARSVGVDFNRLAGTAWLAAGCSGSSTNGERRRTLLGE